VEPSQCKGVYFAYADRKRGWALLNLASQKLPKETLMKKTNAGQQLQRAAQQVKNTSGGGHLGGTNFGQAYDAKTSSASSKGGNGKRPSRKD